MQDDGDGVPLPAAKPLVIRFNSSSLKTSTTPQPTTPAATPLAEEEALQSVGADVATKGGMGTEVAETEEARQLKMKELELALPSVQTDSVPLSRIVERSVGKAFAELQNLVEV